MIFLVRCCLSLLFLSLFAFRLLRAFPEVPMSWKASQSSQNCTWGRSEAAVIFRHQWGTGRATKQLVPSSPGGSSRGRQGRHPRAAPAQGSSPWGCSVCLGELLLWGNAQCWSRGCWGGSLGCLVTLPAVGLCGGSRPTRSCFQKCIWYSWRESDAKATSRGKIWDVATGSTATSRCPWQPPGCLVQGPGQIHLEVLWQWVQFSACFSPAWSAMALELWLFYF